MYGAIAQMAMSGAQMYADKKTNQGILRNAAMDRQAQLDALQHGLSWRVQDAKDSGINPLFALGANVSTPSPIHVGSLQSPQIGEYASRGAGAIGKEIQQTVLERQQLENTLLEQRIQANNTVLDSEGLSSYTITSKEHPGAYHGDRSTEFGIAPQDQYVQGPFGLLNRTYTQDIGDTMESDTTAWIDSQGQRMRMKWENMKASARGDEYKAKFAQERLSERPDYILRKPENRGKELQWDLDYGTWRVMPKQNKFFVQDINIGQDGKFHREISPRRRKKYVGKPKNFNRPRGGIL